MEKIDTTFNNNLTRNQILSKYLHNIRQLKVFAQHNYHITTNQFDNYLFIQYFHDNNHEIHNNHNNNITNVTTLIKTELMKSIMDRKRKILFWLFYLAIAFLCISYKNEASTLVLRNIQTFIYPGMKLWRKMTLPIINHFPGLTELYDESCLMTNPFFQIDDLNCEPCIDAKNVLDLTNIENTIEFIPFVFKIQQKPISIYEFQQLYEMNRDIFQRDAYRVRSTNPDVTNLDELFYDFNRTHQQTSHTLWRCNRMPPARLLRQLFIRPERLPNTGISLERYLSIDTPNSESYTIPDAECSNMYIQQVYGTRTIILRPTIECRNKCRTISIVLPQSFVLSYNWWYWKPISVSDAVSKTISISLIGSYC